MPNVFKNSATVQSGSIKRYNFNIGVSTNVDYGPTSATSFWNGIIPPSSGYTVYTQKASEGPSIRVAQNDSELITIATQYGGTNITTIYDALSYFNGTSTNLATNINYPNIVTSGLFVMLDAGFVPSYARTGTTCNDLSGNAYNGTLTNGPVYNSANGGSIFTDGTNQRISVAGGSLGLDTDSYTFSSWFKNDDYSEVKYLLNRGRDGNGNGWSLLLSISTAGIASSGVVTTVPSTVGLQITGTTTLSLNTWYYITGVWTAGSSIKIYVNGVLEGTSTTSGTTLRSSTVGWQIGSISTTNFTSGYNAIEQVYNRVLSDAEILQNYNAMASRFA